MSEQASYEVVAKNNLVTAQVLAGVVALTRIYRPSPAVIEGVLVLLVLAFSTISTYAWMSR